MVLSAAMATVAIGGMALAVIATFLLPETAGRALQALDDLGDDITPSRAASPELAP